MSILLRPAAILYSTITGTRNSLYDSGIFPAYRSTLPVISVGNLTAGGTGKTPLTALLCAELKSLGHRPVVLSRGYGGRVDSTHLVAPTDPPSLVGDEPRMLADQGEFSVVISPDRVAGAKFIESNNLGSVIVLDDGMQHRRLARTVEILSIDCSSSEAIQQFIAGRVLPEGRFREARDRGLARADVILLNSRAPRAAAVPTSPLEALLPAKTPRFRSFLEITAVRERRNGAELPPSVALLPVCALGNPQGFLATVSTLGHPQCAPVLKADHASFTPEELCQIQASQPEAALVCSAKDAVKIPIDVPVNLYIIRARATVENLAGLMECILAKLPPAPSH